MLRICNTYCCFTTTLVTRTRLTATFIVHSLYFYLIIFRRSLTMENFRRLDCVAVELLSTVQAVVFDILVPRATKLDSTVT
jgi:hypothetical protein